MSSRAAKTARDPLGTSELRRGGDSSASSRLRMTPIRDLGRLLILLGGVLLLAGIALTAFARLGLASLPGDMVYRRCDFSFYFPLMTSLLLSIVPSLLPGLFPR